jgi:muramoyltetrapeptide carboxypeptidase
MRYPRQLSVGARVALVAPAGRINGARDIEHAIANARSFGWEGVPGEHARQQHGYFAGSDDQRIADLERAITDDSIDAVWCIRGGYGIMRILDRMPFDALRSAGKPLIGYSDITALHAAVQRRCGLVTFHGPVARATITDFARSSLSRAVSGDDPFVAPLVAPRVLRDGRATGRLAGGNLALLAALCGTSYAPDFRGCIVIMEDIYEPVYRIDRMLTQLRMAGAFDGCTALAFGQFTEIPGDPAIDLPLDDVLRETADLLGVPALAGLPIGHVDDQWTVPLGAVAGIDADAGTLRLVEPGTTRGHDDRQ